MQWKLDSCPWILVPSSSFAVRWPHWGHWKYSTSAPYRGLEKRFAASVPQIRQVTQLLGALPGSLPAPIAICARIID
jgi:hypothetical protein